MKDPRAYNKAMHLRDKAVRVTRAKKGHAFDGRLGVVIDGTARNFVTVKEDKKKLQRMGYDTFMIFVDSTLETALRRNKERGARGDREVAEPVVIEAWHSAQQNKVRYSQLFGSNMIIVDNSIDRAEHVKLPPDVYVAATHFMAKPLKNPIGKQWVAMELDAKRRGSVHESVLSEIHRDHMPQIQQDTIKDTLRHFKEQGVEYRIELVPASALKPTQENFSTMKVTGMVPMVDELLKQLVFISKDNYLLDGHHRWMAVKQGLGDNTKMRAVRILLDKTEALVQLKIAERDVPMNEVAIFPGRFSPFHPGHYSVYESLVGRFGQDNVYIATSGVTNESSSPFNFDQKKIIMTEGFGIEPSKIVQVRSPYNPVEILERFDRSKTVYVAALCEKDAGRLATKPYYRFFDGQALHESADTRGYYTIIPEHRMNILGSNVSGTAIRKMVSDASIPDQTKRRILGEMYNNDVQIIQLIQSVI